MIMSQVIALFVLRSLSVFSALSAALASSQAGSRGGGGLHSRQHFHVPPAMTRSRRPVVVVVVVVLTNEGDGEAGKAGRTFLRFAIGAGSRRGRALNRGRVSHRERRQVTVCVFVCECVCHLKFGNPLKMYMSVRYAAPGKPSLENVTL